MDALQQAHRLADLADRVSMAHFRAAELRTTSKGDGTPVSEVDLAVEQVMLADVGPTGDAVLGEEVGVHAGSSGRRWIFDGIDGTHNYAAGRPGWGTIVALEDEAGLALGLVSSPALGRRWWAVRGGGAWTAPTGTAASAEPLTVAHRTDLGQASVIVTPHQGFLVGWRDRMSLHFELPLSPRSQCFALDALAVASGALDAAVIVMGGPWDFAATSLIVTEAGGVFTDAWGTGRLDTATGVYTNAELLPALLEVIAMERPDEPDAPRLAKTVSTPIGSADEQAADEWRGFGIRPLPSMSARRRIENPPPFIAEIVDERAAELAAPLRGVTTDGTVRRGLRSLAAGPRVETRPIAEAALGLLQALTADQRARVGFTAEAIERRTWLNVHMNHFRHGLMLEDLRPEVRELALGILRATLSARGYHQARSIMRLNQLLAELTGDAAAFGEWPYFLSIFGEPGGEAPWSWQIDGHHLCINATVFDGRLVLTPTFMGAEPRSVHHGPLAGISLFEPEERFGLDLIRSFDGAQQAQAVIYPSLHPDHIPTRLQNLFDGRMEAGAFHDNDVLPYQGVSGGQMTDAQRRVLTSLAASYVDWAADDHAAVRLVEVEAHLDETWFSWYGGTDDRAPFYYRVHSPVILIEFDHHPGVAFDNEVPSRHHVHTVVRTPNGGDYGADLLAEHHERFDHGGGSHH